MRHDTAVRDGSAKGFPAGPLRHVVERVAPPAGVIRQGAPPPADVPEAFWVRDGDREASRLRLPRDYDPARVEEVALHLRTWNGHNHGTGALTRVGDWTGALPGIDHNYAYTIHPLPPEALKPGENEVAFHSETHHHGVELLWPGPALTIRYRTAEGNTSEGRSSEN